MIENAGLDGLARWLVVAGVALVVAGIAIWAIGRLPSAGHLPGDFVVERDNFRFYFPLATSILLSLVLTIVLNLIARR